MKFPKCFRVMGEIENRMILISILREVNVYFFLWEGDGDEREMRSFDI